MLLLLGMQLPCALWVSGFVFNYFKKCVCFCALCMDMGRKCRIFHKIWAFLWHYHHYECYSPGNAFTLSAETLHAVLLTMLLTALQSVTLFIRPVRLSHVHEKKICIPNLSISCMQRKYPKLFGRSTSCTYTCTCTCVHGTSVLKNSG